MTLEEAIKELQELSDDLAGYPMGQAVKAANLGIEALNWIKEGRVTYTMFPNNPLPGETTE